MDGKSVLGFSTLSISIPELRVTIVLKPSNEKSWVIEFLKLFFYYYYKKVTKIQKTE